jgi:hypothetical protein
MHRCVPWNGSTIGHSCWLLVRYLPQYVLRRPRTSWIAVAGEECDDVWPLSEVVAKNTRKIAASALPREPRHTKNAEPRQVSHGL